MAALVLTAVIASPLTVTAATGSWSVVSSPDQADGNGDELDSVSCVTPNDCWAVGHYLGDTLIEQNTGAGWILSKSPTTRSAQIDGGGLNGVSCPSANDCWAVGSEGTGNTPSNTSRSFTLIEHYTQSGWSMVSSPDTAPKDSTLNSVTCVSDSDCWAVGDSGDDNGGAPLIEHYTGARWFIVSAPDPATTPNQADALLGVACASVDDCWAVGFYGDRDHSSGNVHPLIERYTAGSWSIAGSPPSSPEQGSLYAVTCRSASDCWAVGYYGEGAPPVSALIQHFGGTAWSTVPSPTLGVGGALVAVSCSQVGACWAVGNYVSEPNVYHPLIEQATGSGWIPVNSPDSRQTTLHGVACVSATCWGVGSSTASANHAFHAFIEQYIGVPLGTPQAASDTQTAAAPGDHGQLVFILVGLLAVSIIGGVVLFVRNRRTRRAPR
jgi:hypothetical protein